MSTDVRQIDAATLSSYAIDPDGRRFRLQLHDADGIPVTVVLPIESANQLLMTLPGIIRQALRQRYGDESLRVVYPIDTYHLELGETTRDGIQQFILSLGTDGGFSVSFAGPASVMTDMAHSIFGHVSTETPSELRRRRLS